MRRLQLRMRVRRVRGLLRLRARMLTGKVLLLRLLGWMLLLRGRDLLVMHLRRGKHLHRGGSWMRWRGILLLRILSLRRLDSIPLLLLGLLLLLVLQLKLLLALPSFRGWARGRVRILLLDIALMDVLGVGVLVRGRLGLGLRLGVRRCRVRRRRGSRGRGRGWRGIRCLPTRCLRNKESSEKLACDCRDDDRARLFSVRAGCCGCCACACACCCWSDMGTPGVRYPPVSCLEAYCSLADSGGEGCCCCCC